MSENKKPLSLEEGKIFIDGVEVIDAANLQFCISLRFGVVKC